MPALSLIRAAFGVSLIVRPQLAAGALHAPLDRRAAWLARALGARHVLQAALIGGERWRRAGAAIDGLHATSMLALAALDQGHRRACLTNAGTAAALALASLVSSR